MSFLLRMAFWFSLVLLALPMGGASDGQPTVGLVTTLFAAREAMTDMAGMCERKPEVCETGKAAFHTISGRARESARIAYEMIGNDAPVPAPRPYDAPDL